MQLKQSNDGSFSAYSQNFDECYHSLKDGAVNESFVKHILPSFYFLAQHFQNLDSENLKKFENLDFGNLHLNSQNQNAQKQDIKILDICFGLGINALCAALFYTNFQNLNIEIYSPEFDEKLLKSLPKFPYPHFLDSENFAKNAIEQLLKNGSAQMQNVQIFLHIGDACEFVQKMPNNFFDIVYQDAFSPAKNSELWSEQYFAQIARVLKASGIVSTYSQARAVRENGAKNGLSVYDFQSLNFPKIRGGTLFVKGKIAHLKNYKIKQKIY